MKDPREAKLPKWAKEILQAERMENSLSWPKEPEPKPVAIYHGGALIEGEPIADGGVWTRRSGLLAAERVTFEDGCALSPHGTPIGATGAFYETKRDVLLVLLWEECRKAAAHLNWLTDQIDEITAPRS